MTEKELRKLNRYQLLELLMLQTGRVEALEKELETARAEQEAQKLRFEQLGSLAEASLQITGVLEAAQKAADLYLEAAKQQAEQILQDANKQAREAMEQNCPIEK